MAHEVINNEAEHRFEIRLPDGAVAYAEYRLLEGRVMFPHTVVPPAHEGQGLASAIARTSLDWARAERRLVIPQCAFYIAWMRRHPETHDLVDPGFRSLLGV